MQYLYGASQLFFSVQLVVGYVTWLHRGLAISGWHSRSAPPSLTKNTEKNEASNTPNNDEKVICQALTFFLCHYRHVWTFPPVCLWATMTLFLSTMVGVAKRQSGFHQEAGDQLFVVSIRYTWLRKLFNLDLALVSKINNQQQNNTQCCFWLLLKTRLVRHVCPSILSPTTPGPAVMRLRGARPPNSQTILTISDGQ